MKAIILLAVILFSFNFVFGQKKEINSKGWELPQHGEVKRENQITVDSILVLRKDFEPTDKKQVIKLPSSTSCEIMRVSSYEIKERIFAYRFSCVPFAISQYKTKKYITKRKDYAGAEFIFFLYDEDGDGLFETKYTSFKMPEALPEWVKNLK